MSKEMNEKGRASLFIKKLSKVQGVSALLPLVVVAIFFTLTSDNFLTTDNTMNILRQAAVYAIMATGMTFVLLTGGVDLSQGSVLAMCCVTCAMTINATGNMWLGILVAVASGAVIGIINGIMIAYVNLPPFIMTLGSLYMVRGFTLYITNSTQVSIKGAEDFKYIGQGFFLGIPFPVYVFLIIGIIAILFLTYTSSGRHLFAVGSNIVSARLSGVKVEKTIILAYVLSAACVGLASVVYLARLTAAQPTAGESYEMEAIAAAVVGGTSQAGGEGGILGSLIGAIIIAIIRNGLVLIGVGSYFTKIVVGLIIVLAVTLDVTRRRLAVNR
jgi:ribose transport system permease protein